MKRAPWICIIWVVMFFSALCFGADDLAAVKSRMHQRHPRIEALKSRGVAGENNRGFLDIRGQADGAASELVSEENKDREIVYATLAQQTGASPAQMGKARARQLAQRAKPGEWLQDESGDWKKK